MQISRYVKNENQFITSMTLFFSIIIGIGLWQHEMWRDEYHAWGLVLNSDSLSQMLVNLRGEGHLPFSYIVFYFISRITENSHAMQVAQFCIAITSAYLLLRFAPFKRWQKVLFLFGYFPLYEYGVISRSYSWDMLGLFGFCAVYGWAKEHQRKPWLAWIFLLIMASNESFGILMALPLAGLLVRDLYIEQESKKTTLIWLSSAIAASGLLLSYFFLRVISINQWATLIHRIPNSPADIISTALGVIGRAVLPKIHLPRSIWDFPSLKNHFLALQGVWQYISWFVAMIILLALVYCFVRLLLASVRLPFHLYHRSPVFVLWASGTAILFLFLWSVGGNVDDARHTGHFYLFFVACWWLSHYFPKREKSPSRWIMHVDKNVKNDLRFLLFTHLVFGLFAYCLDIIYPFSANGATATYIQTHYAQSAALVAPESVAISLNRAAYFPKHDIVAKVLLMRDNKQPNYLHNPTKEKISQRVWDFIRSKNPHSNVIIVTKATTSSTVLQKYFRWQSPPAIIDSEQYFLYYVPQNALHAEAN